MSRSGPLNLGGPVRPRAPPLSGHERVMVDAALKIEEEKERGYTYSQVPRNLETLFERWERHRRSPVRDEDGREAWTPEGRDVPYEYFKRLPTWFEGDEDPVKDGYDGPYVQVFEHRFVPDDDEPAAQESSRFVPRGQWVPVVRARRVPEDDLKPPAIAALREREIGIGRATRFAGRRGRGGHR